MRKRLIKALRFVDSLNERVGKIVSFLIPVLAIIEVYEVILRYGFNNPTIWAYEFSAMLFGTFILLGGAYTLQMGSHVNMDILYNLLSKRGRAVLDMVTFFIFLAFIGVMFWKGWESAWWSLKTFEHDSTIWGPPIYPFKLMVPIGALLLLLQGFSKFIQDAFIAIKGEALWEPER